MNLKIVAEDYHYLVVHKPAGMPSVPTKTGSIPSAIETLQSQYPTALTVHRLDTATSGLLIVPLTKKAHRHIGLQFERRVIHKRYTAIVDGILPVHYGTIEAPIITDWPKKPLQKICFKNGRTALTDYQLDTTDLHQGRSRLHLFPFTGRTHQLRLHLAFAGFPIVGCSLYNPQSSAFNERLLLHAKVIRFLHPVKNYSVRYEIPDEF